MAHAIVLSFHWSLHQLKRFFPLSSLRNSSLLSSSLITSTLTWRRSPSSCFFSELSNFICNRLHYWGFKTWNRGWEKQYSPRASKFCKHLGATSKIRGTRMATRNTLRTEDPKILGARGSCIPSRVCPGEIIAWLNSGYETLENIPLYRKLERELG